MRRATYSLILALGLLPAACNSRQREIEREHAAAVEAGQRELDEFRQVMDARLGALEERFTVAQQRTERITERERKDQEAKLDALKQERERLSSELKDLKFESDSMWTVRRHEIATSLDRLEAALRDAST